MKKLYTLFTIWFLLRAVHLLYFLKNIPDSVETKSMLYKGDGQIIMSILILGFTYFFQSKFGYYFMMIIAGVSLLTVFSYGFYFFVIGLFGIPYIIYEIIFFLSNPFIINF